MDIQAARRFHASTALILSVPILINQQILHIAKKSSILYNKYTFKELTRLHKLYSVTATEGGRTRIMTAPIFLAAAKATQILID